MRCEKHPDRKIKPTITLFPDGSRALWFRCSDPDCARREAWGTFLPPKGEKWDRAAQERLVGAVVGAVKATL